MVTHSSVLAWRIPGTGEPGGLPSVGFAQSRTRLKRLSSSSSSSSPVIEESLQVSASGFSFFIVVVGNSKLHMS